ncbi:hypothetical protein GSY74_08010, partial [Sulfurovum sp. bin170]|uniref:hypothetical protein n=1 Tax=Sulfurovum sp. bin170 TaxID=2695268 RepID=UPI001418491E
NYYDENDPVSGHLDYYDGVKNINCNFMRRVEESKENKNLLYYLRHLYPFTHGRYWEDSRMYADIIIQYLNESDAN